MNTNGRLTPKRRFPEFRKPWNLTPIASHLEECASRVDAPTTLPIYTSSRSGLMPQEDYYGGRKVINEGEYGVVPPDCFVFRHMSDDGTFVFHLNETGIDIAVSKEYPVFRAIDADRHFILGKLNHSPDFKAFALSQKAGGTRTRLYFSKLRTWTTLLPSLAEQRKIADCLSSLDDLIAAEGRKWESLRAYKKGLMQQLFPRDGESVPRLRFPEFRDSGEWEEKTLSEIALISSGSTPLRANSMFFDGGRIPWVKTTDLNNSLIRSTEECITEKAKATINPVGSILIAMYGGFKQIGRTGLLTFPAATNQALSVLRLNEKVISADYALEWLNAKVGDWKRIASSSRKDPNITGSDVARFPIQYPTLAEQHRIADCLSALDGKIASQSRKIERLKQHKKGLMQQLFPSREGT